MLGYRDKNGKPYSPVYLKTLHNQLSAVFNHAVRHYNCLLYTSRTYTDEETGQTIIAGMGELHLEIIVDRLLRAFKVEANVGAPQVAYRLSLIHI